MSIHGLFDRLLVSYPNIIASIPMVMLLSIIAIDIFLTRRRNKMLTENNLELNRAMINRTNSSLGHLDTIIEKILVDRDNAKSDAESWRQQNEDRIENVIRLSDELNLWRERAAAAEGKLKIAEAKLAEKCTCDNPNGCCSSCSKALAKEDELEEELETAVEEHARLLRINVGLEKHMEAMRKVVNAAMALPTHSDCRESIPEWLGKRIEDVNKALSELENYDEEKV